MQERKVFDSAKPISKYLTQLIYNIYIHTHKYTTLSFPHFPREPNCWSTLTICKNNKQRKVCLFNTMFRANRCYSYHQIPRLLIFPQFLPSLKYPSYTSISEPNLPKFKSIAPSTNSGVNNLYTSIAGINLARDRVYKNPVAKSRSANASHTLQVANQISKFTHRIRENKNPPPIQLT